MTTVNCAANPPETASEGVSFGPVQEYIKKGALYMPFSIKMSKLFGFNKKIAYDLGMPFLSRLCHGFGADRPAPKAKSKEATEQLWALSMDFCRDNGVKESILMDI